MQTGARFSQLFIKTLKEDPAEEQSKNAKLLIRAGFIHKEMAGAYDLLPLGLRVSRKIIGIIRNEMENLGAQEVLMTSLQNPETWKKTNRWSDDVVDVWFKTKLKNGALIGLGLTHEDPLTKMLKAYVQSYKDLPQYIFQFQTKFRNETRAKSGILRTREFLMKDLYSFCRTQKEQQEFYESVKKAYFRIFAKLGLETRTILTFASGGAFSKYSHEFQVISDAGEDTIYISRQKNIAVNKEVLLPEVLEELDINEEELEETRAIEVGNIFNLGTRFSKALDLTYTDETGQKQYVIMGSYGIGVYRVMGTIAEVLSDDKGLVWPETVAPYKVHLVNMNPENGENTQRAEKLYATLTQQNVEVLYDDRKLATAGQKLKDADLMGMPFRALVSTRNGDRFEIKRRTEKDATLATTEELIHILA